MDASTIWVTLFNGEGTRAAADAPKKMSVVAPFKRLWRVIPS